MEGGGFQNKVPAMTIFEIIIHVNRNELLTKLYILVLSRFHMLLCMEFVLNVQMGYKTKVNKEWKNVYV